MKNSRGQVLVFVLLFIPILLIILAFTLSTGKMVYYRIKLQNATDAACYTAALWQARGLNVISDLNWALLASCGGELISLKWDFKISREIQKAQDAAAKSFPGASALAMYNNFKQNIEGSTCLPVPAGIKDMKMFSLGVKRRQIFMEKDEPARWIDQKKRGPLIRLIGIRAKDKIVFGGDFLGISIPGMYSVCQAMPYREGDAGQNGGQLGGLWDPSFYAKLTPVSADIPLVKGVILH